MWWFVLAYDAPVAMYEADEKEDESSKRDNVRRAIIKLLLGFGTRTIESYTQSTIHFECKDTEAYKSISAALRENLPYLKFSLGVITRYENGNPLITLNEDTDLRINFDILVMDVKRGEKIL